MENTGSALHLSKLNEKSFDTSNWFKTPELRFSPYKELASFTIFLESLSHLSHEYIPFNFRVNKTPAIHRFSHSTSDHSARPLLPSSG